jgi:hypothetical protein
MYPYILLPDCTCRASKLCTSQKDNPPWNLNKTGSKDRVVLN